MWEYSILEQIEASKWKQRAGRKSRTEVSRINLRLAELGARRQAMSKVTGKVFPSQNSIPIQISVRCREDARLAFRAGSQMFILLKQQNSHGKGDARKPDLVPGHLRWEEGFWEERAGDFTLPRSSSPLRRRKRWLPGRGDEDMPWHRVHIFRGFAVLVMIHCAIRCRWIKTEQIENNSRDSLSSAQCHRGKKRVVVLGCQLLGDLEAPAPGCDSTSKSRLKEVGRVTLNTGSTILRAKATDWMREKPRGAPEFISLSFPAEAIAWSAASNSCHHSWEGYLHGPQHQRL